jgi:hypothetical protein
MCLFIYLLGASSFFLIGIVGGRGGVQLGPLDTAATNRPIVPAPGDYDGEIGGMIGRGNRNTRRKAAAVPLCPPKPPHACPDAKSGRHGGKPATVRPMPRLTLFSFSTIPFFSIYNS